MLNLVFILLKDTEFTPAFGGLTAGEVAQYGISIVVFLIIVAVLITVIGPLIYSLKHFKESWKGIAALLGVILLGFICYTMADGTLTQYVLDKKLMDSPWQMKLVNGAMNMFLVLFLATTALFVFSILRDVFDSFTKN